MAKKLHLKLDVLSGTRYHPMQKRKGGVYKASKSQEKIIKKREAKQRQWLSDRAKRRKSRKGFEP